MNQQAQTKNCQNCKQDFVIEPEDFGFYKKIKVLPPTFCSDCRRQRRDAWRNTFSLYSGKCDLCQKSIISLYAPDSGMTVYCNKCWWSDRWDAKDFAMDYDFSRPFFEQHAELMKKVPQIALVNDDGIASLNCEYTHDWWFSKNCYMCFSGWYVENVMYSFFITAGRDMMDCMNIAAKSEWIYECIRCSRDYNVTYSRFCFDSLDSHFMDYSGNCKDCFMCVGLMNKKYNFKNKQYSKEDYEKILQNYRLDTWSGVEKTKKEYKEFILKFPHRYAMTHQVLNCTGDNISNSKNCKNSFVVRGSENCRYSEFLTDDKDCYDLVMTGETLEGYETVVGDHCQLNLFGIFSVKSQDIRYTQHCHNGKYLFGCVGLKNAKYCIFNKQYTKEEYEELVEKIIENMNNMPYKDKNGCEYKYGEFYPIELSPFGYNETLAMEQIQITKEDALKRGYKWQDNIQRTLGRETLRPENIPDSINDIEESILKEVLMCVDCNRNYKIVQNELTFYKKMKIPIPRKCFQCRHEDRLKNRNPFKLWPRVCMCDGSTSSPNAKKHAHHIGKCEVEFETSYAPDRPEIIYCEKCYQAEVY